MDTKMFSGDASRGLMMRNSNLLVSMDTGITSPYDQFRSAQDTSLPSGNIFFGGSTNPDQDAKAMDTVHVIRKFEEYIEVMSPLSDDEEEKLRQMTIEEKWKIIFNEQTRDPISPVQFYTDFLRRYLSSLNDRKLSRKASVRRSNKESKQPITTLSHVLKKLKLDLKMSFDSFIEDFVSDKYNGIPLLVAVLSAIQVEQTASMSLSRKNRAEQYKQTLLDEYDCLLCIKFAFRIERAIPLLLKRSDAIDTISMCLMSHFRKTTTVALEILTAVCDIQEGYSLVDDTMTRQRIKFGESVRFKMVVSMLHSGANFHFQAVCVRFFNKLWNCAANSNTRVYFQHELKLAGYDPDQIDRLNPLQQEVKRQSGQYSMSDSPEFEELQKELDVWRRNYIDVSTAREDMTELETRNSYLRQEIDRLTSQIGEMEGSRGRLEKEQGEWKEKCERYRERAAVLQDTVEKLTHLYEEKLGETPGEVDVQAATRPLDMYTTMRGMPRNDKSSDSLDNQSNGDANSIPEPPPTPAPPPVPPAFLSQTIRKKVVTKVNLPLFNWTPIYSIRKTIFEDIDDEAKLREIDFTEFEEQFQLPVREESQESRDRRQRALQKAASKIYFVDTNRAKNMIITKKRTGLTAKEIRDAVEHCDTRTLCGEYAELLLKYVPTKDEVKQLAAHAHEYTRLGEAEQLLFQLAQVDRIESRLSMLAFIGIFDELINTVKPQMERLYTVSKSVTESSKLKKIFEIILAFGNYMNSSKRGYALGYKLESLMKLSEVKSTDKKQTLMNYLAFLIEEKYPELLNFHEELDVEVDRGVSYQAIAFDLQGLRKGIDLIKYEMDRSNRKNPEIERFHAQAGVMVADVAEGFKKMAEAYRVVCNLFSENYKTAEPEEIFRYISLFTSSFQKAVEENHKRREQNSTPTSTPVSTPREKSTPRDSVSTQTTLDRSQSGHPPSPRKRNSLSSDTSNNLNTPSKSDKPIGAKDMNFRSSSNIAHPSDDTTHITSSLKHRSSPGTKRSSSIIYKAKRETSRKEKTSEDKNRVGVITNGVTSSNHVTKVSVTSSSDVSDLTARHVQSENALYTNIDAKLGGGMTSNIRAGVSSVSVGNGRPPVVTNGTRLTREKYTAEEREALNSLNEVIDNFDGRNSQESYSTSL